MDVAPYGEWRSPITPEIASKGTKYASAYEVRAGSDGAVYCAEPRPDEGGRIAILRVSADGVATEVTPPGFNARTRVYEYGGGAWVPLPDGSVISSSFADGRLYRLSPGTEPQPVTAPSALRFGDLQHDGARDRLIAVCEDHAAGDADPPVTLVAISLSGEVTTLVQGHDFFAFPAVEPSGEHLAWIAWDHPDMPFDSGALYVARFDDQGVLGEPRQVAGGPGNSAQQPRWATDGSLYFVAEPAGWWNIFRERRGRVEPVAEGAREFGEPLWTLGYSTYDVLVDGTVVAAYIDRGLSRLAIVTDRGLEDIPNPYSEVINIVRSGDRAYFIAGSATLPPRLVELHVPTRELREVRAFGGPGIDPAYVSSPEVIEFPTTFDRTAFALYYPPRNPDFQAPAGDLPPLRVLSHGGPTAAAGSILNPAIQFWTSRGFAVVDVNYGGSTGFGRAYRDRLKGTWGIVDVDDCVAAAEYLVGRGLANPRKLTIAGGSAGGYTTLAALAFRDVFSAGASYYGVSDPMALARDTHKFEARYLDGLIAPYPEGEPVYNERSPIHHVEGLSAPLILFQGLDDKIVLPNQSEMMRDALRRKGVPVAYIPFEGEGHGFRKAENAARVLEAELYFYGRVLGFAPAGDLRPVEIEGL